MSDNVKMEVSKYGFKGKLIERDGKLMAQISVDGSRKSIEFEAREINSLMVVMGNLRDKYLQLL